MFNKKNIIEELYLECGTIWTETWIIEFWEANYLETFKYVPGENAEYKMYSFDKN